MIKTSILSVLFLTAGWAAQAQSSENQTTTQDTTHKNFTHRGSWRGQGPNNQNNSFAQGRGGFNRNRGFQQRGSAGMAPIHYTPEQRKQVATINSDFKTKQEALYKQDNLTLGAYKAQLLSLQKDRKAKRQALLTAQQQEQIAKWKSRQSENQQVMAAAHLERMKIDLKLSDDQEAKIKSQNEAFRAQVQSIRGNDDLLPEQKREQMKAAFAKQKDAIAAVLTPDQQAKLKTEFHQRGRFGRMGQHIPAPADN